MATIRIDGEAHEVDGGANLLEAALKLGYDLPFFCWHEALGSVGACRQCAVKVFRDDADSRGSIQMACMVPAKDGIRLSILDGEATEARRSVIEWLMINHPHDCPVCDEGGECHLQDMTVMTGHNYREHRFGKRTYPDQDLGPFVHHEMNRCIQCYRCVRFYDDHAGGKDLAAFGSRDNVWFGRHEPGALESPFSGNLVEVCPTGVFTDKTQRRHYTRKWDLTTAPSVCTHCSVGCNTVPGERAGILRRIRNRHNPEVNGWFLCDRGRFGYEFVNHGDRIRRPVRGGVEVGADALIGLLDAGSGRRIGIGSPRASLEDNFALRDLVGPDQFYAGIAEDEQGMLDTILRILREGPAPSASVADLEGADAVLILGEDVTATAPRMALALRQAARSAPVAQAVRELKLDRWNDQGLRAAIGARTGPFFVVSTVPTPLDGVATRVVRAAPDDVARVGHAVAHALGGGAPAVDLPPDLAGIVALVATALREAQRPVVVSGTSSGRASIESAANVAWALRRAGRPASLALVVPEANSLGLALLGGKPLGEALAATDVDTAVVLGNDLYRRAPAAAVDAWFARVGTVIVLDTLRSRTTDRASLVLPLAAFSEATGTFVSGEGRAQRHFQVSPPNDPVRAGWRWLQTLSSRLTQRDRVDGLHEAIEALPGFAGVIAAAPPSTWRRDGQRVPRQPHRNSGHTAIHAGRTMQEPPPPEDRDSPLAFSLEGTRRIPPALRSFVRTPGWNSEQAVLRLMAEARDAADPASGGRRLLEPAEGPTTGWLGSAPAPFERPVGAFLLVEVHEVFGTEELSALAPGIAERTPAPYLLLGPEDAAAFGAGPVTVLVGGERLDLPVRLAPGLPRGVAGLPRGLRALSAVWGLPLPAPAELRSAT